MPMQADRLFRISDVAFLGLAVLAALVALSAVPIWLEQAFAYSATFGRSEPAARDAATAFGCRADFMAWLGFSTLGLSLLVRWLSLRATRGLGFWAALQRDLIEHLAIVAGCWLVESLLLRQEPLRSILAGWANAWCIGGK